MIAARSREMGKIRLGHGFSISLLVILALATFFIFWAGKSNNTGTQIGNYSLPAFASINSGVEEAYIFATENPDALKGINCHCGCMFMQHEGRLHSRGLLDCFRKNDGRYDVHGSQCQMCVNDALQVKRLVAADMPKEFIKNAIDSKYPDIHSKYFS